MKYLIYVILILTFYTCTTKNYKELIIENKLQGVKLIFSNFDIFDCNQIQKIQLKDYSFFKLRDSLESVLYSCKIEIFNDLECYKKLEDYYGEYYDPRISNDSLNFYFKNGYSKIVEIDYARINKSDFRILHLKLGDFIKTICIIILDKRVIYIKIIRSAKKEYNTVSKNNTLLKRLKVIKLNESINLN